jgi:hypothetical protein
MGVLPQVTEDLTIIKIIKFVGICFICHKNIMSQNSYYMYYKTLPEHKLYKYGTKFNKKLLQLFQLLICKEMTFKYVNSHTSVPTYSDYPHSGYSHSRTSFKLDYVGVDVFEFVTVIVIVLLQP